MGAKTRLVLSTIGAPDLLDVSSPSPEIPPRVDPSPGFSAKPPVGRDPLAPATPDEDSGLRTAPVPPFSLAAVSGARQEQTETDLLRGPSRRRSLSVDADLHTQLSDTASSAGVGLSTLVVALLARGLASTDDVGEVAVAERVRRVDVRDQRIRLQMPLPGGLVNRLDGALAEARRRSPRATAADVANGILAEELPAPEAAARIVFDFRRQIEQLAGGSTTA